MTEFHFVVHVHDFAWGFLIGGLVTLLAGYIYDRIHAPPHH